MLFLISRPTLAQSDEPKYIFPSVFNRKSTCLAFFALLKTFCLNKNKPKRAAGGSLTETDYPTVIGIF